MTSTKLSQDIHLITGIRINIVNILFNVNLTDELLSDQIICTSAILNILKSGCAEKSLFCVFILWLMVSKIDVQKF